MPSGKDKENEKSGTDIKSFYFNTKYFCLHIFANIQQRLEEQSFDSVQMISKQSVREYRLLMGGKGVNLGLTQRLIIGKDRGKRQRGSNPLPSTKTVL